MRHLEGNHTVTKANAAEYADVTSIGGDAYIRADFPALTTIGGYAYIYAACPALTTIGGGADIRADCPALTSIWGKPVASPEEQREWRRKVAQHVAENPAEFNMAIWHCGTQHCLAGTAQYLAGSEWSERAGVQPETAGACLLGPSVASMFYRTSETEAVRAEIMAWLN